MSYSRGWDCKAPKSEQCNCFRWSPTGNSGDKYCSEHFLEQTGAAQGQAHLSEALERSCFVPPSSRRWDEVLAAVHSSSAVCRLPSARGVLGCLFVSQSRGYREAAGLAVGIVAVDGPTVVLAGVGILALFLLQMEGGCHVWGLPKAWC